MNERIYYTDAYQTEFAAHIIAVTTINGRPAVVLDQSAFYPTSGGQPHDTGWLRSGVLADLQVLDVVVSEQGQIAHILADVPSKEAVGQVVYGVIDWPRRWDHMQQHAGQHLLSQVFYQRFGSETLSVHFGEEESTLDLDMPDLSPAQLEEAEKFAAQLVGAALPIKVYFLPDTELHTIPLRRAPKVQGTVRIVEIAGFDYSACGGTHCRTTAEIGPIKLTRVERRRGQIRVTFLCGNRAWQDYRLKQQLITEAATLFSTEIAQVPILIERNLSQLKEAQRQIETLQTELLGFEAQQLLATATALNGYRLLQTIFPDKEVATVKRLASQLQQQAGVICLFGSVQEGKATLIFARAADVKVHMGNLLRDGLQTIGGKGGGKEDFAQGGGITAQQAAGLVLAAAAKVATLLA